MEEASHPKAYQYGEINSKAILHPQSYVFLPLFPSHVVVAQHLLADVRRRPGWPV